MLSPSWPSPASARRAPVPPAIRRRVRAAERRAMRRAVTLGSVVAVILLGLDLATNVVGAMPGVLILSPFELGVMVLTALIGFAAHRALVRPEALAFVVLISVFGVGLLGMGLMPGGSSLAIAELAIILLGAGLFLPWERRWHAAGLGSALGLTLFFVASPWGATMSIVDRTNLLAAVVMAGATSLIGQGIWQRRLRKMLEQQFALRHLSRYAQRQEAHVSELNRELNRVARRDSLTGVGNRRALDEAIGRLLDQGDRLRPTRFAIILFDIDHFKQYNDEHGHLAGDAALGRLGEILRRATRDGDHAFRYGGEEFLLLLPEVDLQGALAVAERVRIAALENDTGLPPFTVSGGVALCDPADGRDPEPLIRRADTALYLAKRAGRNRIAADELSIAMQRQALALAQ